MYVGNNKVCYNTGEVKLVLHVPELAQERGLAVSKGFKGTFTMGARVDGKDCAVSSEDINGKVCPT